jgi:diguanylate cyclase (GGDEF)-like protein
VRRLSPGEQLAGFEVVGVLGSGSEVVVYRVRRGLDDYAMKLAAPRPGERAGDRALRREAALLACVDHPHVTRVLEVGVASGWPYLVMELVEGRPLAELVAEGALPAERVVAIGIDVAGLLAAAHRAGIVHRDLKPGNVVVDRQERARVVDFSLAARSGYAGTDVVAGTMLYCAPEQSGMLDRPVDGRADLYALGAVLYECATGAPPYTATSVGELLRQHASSPVPDPRARRPDLPPALAALIGRLLAKDPDDRYPTSEALLVDLRRLAGGAGGRPNGAARERRSLRAPGRPNGGAPAPPGARGAGGGAVGGGPGGADRAEPTAGPDGAGTVAEPPAVATRRLVGRAPELAALADRWTRARRGEGGVALICGPAGGGKSRLAAELLATAAGSGAVVLAGKSEADESVPLAAVRRALESHVRWIGDQPAPQSREAVARVRAAAGPAAPLLGGISPALGELLGSPVPAEDDGRQLFASAAVGFLVALARSAGGLLFCLDDVQWLDDGTRRVVRRLTTEIGDAPLLLLAAARDGAPSRGAVSSFRSGLGATLDLTVSLDPLRPAAVAELVADATGGMRLAADAAAALAAHSDGNPFVVLECLPAIVDAGLLRPTGGTWSIDSEGLRDLDLSADADTLVLDRLDGLDPVSRDLLGVAAVIGPRFSAGLLAEVGGIDGQQARDVAGAAAWRHLVEAEGPDGYVFVHDRIREALLARFDERARAAVHGRVAEALDRGAGRDAAAVYALARHCQMAGTGPDGHDPDRTYRACVAAGRQALADHAPTQALSFFDTAAGAARRAGTPLDVAFHRSRGIAQHRAGLCSDAVESFDRAHGLARDPLERARILHLLARVHDSTWDTAGQIETANRALQELGESLPRNPARRWASTMARFAGGLTVRLTRTGHGTVRGPRRQRYRLLVSLYDVASLAHARNMEVEPAIVHSLRQFWWVSRLGPGPESVHTDIVIAHLALAGGSKRLAQGAARRAMTAADAVGDPRLRAYVDWLWALDSLWFGLDQGEGARRVYAEQGRWLDVGHAGDLLLTLTVDAILRGDLAETEDLWARRTALVAAHDQGERVVVHAVEPTVLALQGQGLAAVTQLRRMRAARPDPLRWEHLYLVIAEMMVAIENHELDTMFDEAAAAWDASGIRLRDLMPVARNAYAFRAWGRLEQCRSAPPGRRAERLAEARVAVGELGRAASSPLLRAHHRAAEAALAQVSGDHETALRLLERAGPVLRAVPAPTVAFEAARVRARALGALAVEDEARRQAALALALAADHRWPHRARRVATEFGLDHQAPRISSGHTSSDAVAVGRYRQRLDAIQQVGLAASKVLDPARLTAIALDETIRILGAERAYLFLVDEGGDELVPAGGRDAEGNDLGEPTGHSSTLVERVRATREPLVVTGPEDGDARGAQSIVLHGLRSIMVAPLLRDERLAGVVYLDSRVAKGIFTADDVGVLVAITSHVVVALETARAAQLEAAITRANQQRDLAETMRDALANISGSLQPDQVLRRVLSTVLRVTRTHQGWLVLAADGEGPARVISRRAADGDDAADDDSRDPPWRALPAEPTGAAGATGPADRLLRLLSVDEPVIGGGAGADRFDRWDDCGVGSWMAIPLVARDRRVGVVALASERPDAFAAGEADMAVALVGQGMVAYDNACLFAQVQRLAATDGLTGVANRRHFFEEADRALGRARDGGHPLAAMMIDVDNFKAINDRHGHRVGDSVLQALAERLSLITPDPDLIGRYGGEEFAVVLAADGAGARAVAERLRRAVADAPVPTPAGPVSVTISVGVALVGSTDDDSTLGDLLDRADECLYRAKRAGRNRVLMEPPATPGRGGPRHAPTL